MILCLGEMHDWSGENTSRASIALQPVQENLARALHATGTPIVMLLSNGRPMELTQIDNLCQAILEVWQPGTDGASVIAGILAGDINPSGKLSMSFPYSNGQIPVYYGKRKNSRTWSGFYHDIPGEPLYPFGHGLSYTTFEYCHLSANTRKITPGQELTFEIEVRNTGGMDGSEAVLWYVSDPVCSVMRPAKELKYFEKVSIPSGESRKVRFKVDLLRDFGFVDANGDQFIEDGEFVIAVGDKSYTVMLEGFGKRY